MTSPISMQWAVAQRPLPGQRVSGDLHLVAPFRGGVLLAVVDGVGHGPEATQAAKIAIDVLRERPADSVQALVGRCHSALRETRGVVMTLASWVAGTQSMTWLAVGNVEGVLFRTAASEISPIETVLLRGGLVGAQVPTLQAKVVPLQPRDVLIMASDGIRSGFEQDLLLEGSPDHIANRILEHYFKGTDDAMVLVARYLGVGHD